MEMPILTFFLLPLVYAFGPESLSNNQLASAVYTPNCNAASEMKISTCAEELTSLGVFSQNSEQMTLHEMRSRSRQYFVQMCGAYNRYNTCLGGSYIKQACYVNEPLKSRYAVADVALEYVCGEGYESMVNNWECYLSVAASQEISQCEEAFMKVASRTEEMYNDYSLGAGACFALQTYIDCIRPSIELACGITSFETVIAAIERPVHVYLPYCTLSATGIAPSFVFILFSLYWYLL